MGFIFIGEPDPRFDCPPDRVYLLDPNQVATSDDNGETWWYPFVESLNLPPEAPTDDDDDEWVDLAGVNRDA